MLVILLRLFILLNAAKATLRLAKEVLGELGVGAGKPEGRASANRKPRGDFFERFRGRN